MNMFEAFRSGFEHWDFWDGRASRSAYWWLVVALLLACFVMGLAAGIIGAVSGIAASLVVLVTVVVAETVLLSAAVRRLHDTGLSGWWALIGFVPLVGIVLLVFLALPSDKGPNKFGPVTRNGVSDSWPFSECWPRERTPPVD